MGKLLTLVLLVLLTLSGCSRQKLVPNSTPPTWIMNPNQGGKTGAVGSSNRVYDGKRSTKRTLAITRALDELSLQKGVKVQMNMTKVDKVSNNKSTMSMDTDSTYEADATITAHIEDAWENPISKELFIWMVLD